MRGKWSLRQFMERHLFMIASKVEVAAMDAMKIDSIKVFLEGFQKLYSRWQKYKSLKGEYFVYYYV